ncbi:MAG: DUF5666 domain-containing protein [Chloroflexota bacterium]|nr:DUF5666 domain-containing protein [Chloroflexota bacterium]
MSILHAARTAALLLVAALVLTSCGSETRADTEPWDIEGPLLAREANIWIVDAAPILVPDDVAITGNVVLGSTVTANGVFDSSGQRVAQEIRIEAGPLPESTLPEIAITGVVESIDGNLWNVDGRDVIVANGTQISSTEPGGDATQLIQIGNPADITRNLLDDEQIVAREIVLRRQVEVEQPDSVDQPSDNQPPSEENQPVDPEPVQEPLDDTDDQRDDSNDDGDNRENKEKREKPAKPDKSDEDSERDDDDDDDDDDEQAVAGRPSGEIPASGRRRT